MIYVCDCIINIYLELHFCTHAAGVWNSSEGAPFLGLQNIMNIYEVQRSNGVTRRNLVVQWYGLQLRYPYFWDTLYMFRCFFSIDQPVLVWRCSSFLNAQEVIVRKSLRGRWLIYWVDKMRYRGKFLIIMIIALQYFFCLNAKSKCVWH